ncbi:MAG: glycosyltransferase [Deltaproteobacteria bacterium]|nr:glycosyltransferase [Deltaproteobacteria bacterium]
MIVRNEERYLADCLESVNDFVDEMIIVDTGSTDRTVEIAQIFGARVYHHLWENDFSKHRNQSIGYAKGDWILWMDADEQLEPDGGKVLRKAIANTDADSLMVTMVCYFENRTRQSWNNSIKLFRNGLGIHFEGFVHNRVVGCKSTGFCPVKIYHFGYDIDQTSVRKKFQRTGSLLRKAIHEDPLNFKHHHDLAVAFSSVHRFREAVYEGLTAIRLHKEQGASDPNILWTYFVVASSYYNLQMWDEAKSFAQEAVSINPDHFDSFFVLASVYAAQKDMKRFLEAYDRFDELAKKYSEKPELMTGLVVNKIDEKWRLDLEYGTLLLENGSTEEAAKRLQEAAGQASAPPVAFRLATVACRERGYPDLAKIFLQRAEEAGLETQLVEFERALIQNTEGNRAGYLVTIHRLLGMEVPEPPEFMHVLGVEALKIGELAAAEKLLTGAIQRAYENAGIFNALALACKYLDKWDEAVQWNQRALELDEKNTDALSHLGHLHYDRKEWESAKTYYMKSLSIDGYQRDPLFRLSLLALMDQDLEQCISYCDRLMAELDIPRNRVIGNLENIAMIYDEIGEAFSKSGEKLLHLEALSFSKCLRGR